MDFLILLYGSVVRRLCGRSFFLADLVFLGVPADVDGFAAPFGAAAAGSDGGVVDVDEDRVCVG